MIFDLQKNSVSYQKYVDIYTTTILDLNIINRLTNTIKNSGDKQQRKTNAKAYMTNWNMSSLPGFNELTGIIHYLSEEILIQNNLNQDFTLKMVDMWGLIYNKGDKTSSHDHIPSYLSGTYYVKCNETNAPLLFPELNYSIKPTTGMIVLFPSNIKHEVPEEYSDDERIVVAFNLELLKK